MAASIGLWLRLLLALLSLLGEASGDSGASREDDVLLPYSLTRARFARDCARVHTGRLEHETWPGTPGASDPDVHAFVSHFGLRAVSGHLTWVSDPARTFSVLEPGGPGGCSNKRRATVEETSRPAGCLVAQNGGFFRMDTGECLGNVVSDGRMVSSSGGLQNAQFGIRRDGTLVTGYLSEEEVLDTENPFIQLLSGVVWLIRNGSIYINESQATECDETQETGSFSKFVNVISARTAVGHDRSGRLLFFHADGQTGQRGVNLWEVADFLLKQDVVNAINLDGGGSATFVVNGTLANYPSDHCQDSRWRCARRVSTVVCIHALRCQPPDCNGHGTCVAGRCQCRGHFWQGDACDWLDCGPSNCSGHGLCSETGCRCEAGWMGTNCSEACSSGFFGEDCARPCLCQNGGTCDPVQGTCSCPKGFSGDTCAQVKQFFQLPEDTPQTGEPHLLTGTAWLGLTLALGFCLLVSFAVNLAFMLGLRAEQSRHLDGTYDYHPLQEMNGELLAPEKELPSDTGTCSGTDHPPACTRGATEGWSPSILLL